MIEAHGREHPGQQPSNVELPRGAVPHVNDVAGRLIPYGELYTYDEVGNIRQVVHQANGAGWTRDYNYAPDNNRLLSTSVPGGGLDVYGYADTTANNGGAHGSMTSMPRMNSIEWDYADRMQHANLGGGGDVYFTYDASGNRMRKVWVHGNRVDERIYHGSFEIYREHTGGALNGPVQIERETLHVFDDKARVAMVETKTADTTGSSGNIGASTWRLQLSNHLGSSALELTQSGAVISYEEYHPFGSTAFHTAQGSLGVSTKRYRYTGKERDEETGLYYHGARYYAPWLGRWIAADPLGLAEPGRADLNLYAYVSNRPLVALDPTGLEGEVDVPQTDRQKIEASLRASGVDVGGPPPIVDDAVALQMLQSGVAKPESEITIGNETFLPEMTITGDAELAGRAKAAGNSVELQEFLEHTPGVIQKQDVTGFLKGLVNSPAATIEGASNLVGLDLQLSEFKLSLNSNEGSGSLIGEGLGPGPLAVAGATAKGLGRLGMALELTPNLPLSVAARGVDVIDTALVRFSQDSVKGAFRNGTTLNEAAAALRAGGPEAAATYPAIRLFERNSMLYTLDNRRLLVFSEAGMQVPFRMATEAELAKEFTSKFSTTGAQSWGQFVTVRP